MMIAGPGMSLSALEPSTVRTRVRPSKPNGFSFSNRDSINLLVEGLRMQSEDLRGAHRQRAVHIDGDCGNLAALEEVVQHVEELLGALHREGGDDDFPPRRGRLADDFSEVMRQPGGASCSRPP